MSHYGNEIVPGKGKRKGAKPRKGFHFLDHDLTVQQRDDLEAMDLEGEYPLADILALVDQGYTVKIAPDSKGGGARFHLMDDQLGEGDEWYCLSGRGSTAKNAWYGLAYRHFTIAAGDWAVFTKPGGSKPDIG